jgi:DNA-binding NarL/FixJ family response regulator
MIRVVIVGNVRVFREGLAQALHREGRLTVSGVEAALGDGLLAGIQDVQPDVLLLDMTAAESHATARRLVRSAPGVPVVAVGVPELEDALLACVETGVAGYVTREGSLADLVATVESAARGELLCSPEIAGSLLRRLVALAGARQPQPPSPAALTPRERQIARLLEQDLSNKEIAAHLHIEVATVKNHVHNLLEKLHVHRRTEAVRLLHDSPGWTRRIDL